MKKLHDVNSLVEEHFIWLRVSEVSVPHDGRGVAQHLKSWQQDVEEKSYRKKSGQRTCPGDILPAKTPPPSFHLCPIEPSYYESIKNSPID